MITINFHAGRCKPEGPSSPGIFAYSASFVAVLLICGYGLFSLQANVRVSRERRDTLSSQVMVLRQKSGDVANLEQLKSELRRQLLMVATLKKRKRGPVRLLDDINTALPERAWITEMSEKGGVLQIRGKALDNQTISDFMRNLSGSHFLLDVDLNESKQETVEGVKVQAFNLKARAMYGGRDMPDTLGH